jgi:hypothetical protein
MPMVLIANAAAGQIQARKVPAAQIISMEGSNRRSQWKQGGKRNFTPECEPTRDKPVQR